MVGTVYDYNSLYIRIISGEKRKIIFFTSDEEYEENLNKGMEIGKNVIFDSEKDKIIKFF